MTKLSCPNCAARYNVPPEKLGKRVKCARCGEHFHLAPPAADDGLFPELESLQTGTTLSAAAGPAAPLPGAIPPPHVNNERALAAGPAQLAAYLKDVVGFARILAQPWELLTLVVVCGICLLQIPAAYAGCLGLGAKAVITGWYLSFLLKTVQAGANREDGLPDFSLTDGVIEDIVRPSLSFLVVRLLAALPLVAALIFAVQDNRLDGAIAFTVGFLGVAMPELALITALLLSAQFPNLATVVVPPLLIGLAAVPMLVLVVAIAGIGSLVRIDLMLTTIVRTLPGYIAAMLIYFASLGVAVGVGYVVQQSLSERTVAVARTSPPGPPTAAPVASAAAPAAASDPNAAAIDFAGSLIGQAVAMIAGVFASVFAMRAIGLYYAHFKGKFAWSWG